MIANQSRKRRVILASTPENASGGSPECLKDEQHQVELLKRFRDEGIKCKALMS